MTTADTRWAAVATRDLRADGSFVYAVRTTGIYCRPSCPAKLARPENVRFFNTNLEAEASGFRACKRCSPNGASPAQRDAGKIAAACRKGRAGETIRYSTGVCSLGPVHIARSERGVCAILLGDDDLRARFPRATFVPDDGQALAEVIRMIDVPGAGLHLPLDLRGTVFQQRVWQALRTIPSGTTATYTEIANKIGAPASIRAVATACAANSLAVAIPCHRVIRSNGELAGYRWGLDRKRALLKREEQK